MHNSFMRHWTLDYVLAALEKKDWSPTRLAKEAGVSASTINRPLRERDWPYGLKPQTVAKIHRVTGLDPKPFMPTGMQEPAQMYLARPKTTADRVLENLPPADQETAQAPSRTNEIRIDISGETARIIAVVDHEGLQTLRSKLDALEIVLAKD